MVSSLLRVFSCAALLAAGWAGQSGLDEPKASGVPAVQAKGARPMSPEDRGDLMMARKMYREAMDAYREGDMNSAVIRNKLGIAYHQMLQLDLAKKEYERAIKLNPKYSEAINNLGTVYYARRSYRRSVNLYKRALKLAPASASIYSNLGTAYFARKKYQDAADAYQEALRLDPDIFEHRNTYGVLLQERNVVERAKFHYYLAKTYAKAGMNERALQYLRKALEEGFKDKKKLAEDPEFTALRDTPAFQELLKMEPRVL